jgi:hypothetical protein
MALSINRRSVVLRSCDAHRLSMSHNKRRDAGLCTQAGSEDGRTASARGWSVEGDCPDSRFFNCSVETYGYNPQNEAEAKTRAGNPMKTVQKRTEVRTSG